MGMFSDYRGITKQAKQLTPPEHRGVRGGFRAMSDAMSTTNQALGQVGELQARAAHLQGHGRQGVATIVGRAGAPGPADAVERPGPRLRLRPRPAARPGAA